MKKITRILLAIVVVTSIGCKKDDDKSANTAPAKTNTELLTSGPWQINSGTIDPALIVNGAVITDYFAQLEPCDQDDLNTFMANGKGLLDEGPLRCDLSDPQTSPFTWTFNSDETIVTTVDADGEVENLNIVSLTAVEIIAKSSLEVDSIKYTITYKATHP